MTKLPHPIRTNPHAQLRAQLRALRESEGLTQTELSDRSGVTQRKISEFESGAGDITTTTLVRLGEALGAPVRFDDQ